MPAFKFEALDAAGKPSSGLLDAENASLRESETGLHGQIELMRVQIDPAERDLETAEQEESRMQESEAAAQRVLAERTSSLIMVEHAKWVHARADKIEATTTG